MAVPAAIASGTQTATGAEDTLATISSPRNCVLRVDTSNLAIPDSVKLRIYVKVLPGSTPLVLYAELISGVQLDPIFDSPPVASPHQLVATLEQTSGAFVNFDWAVIQV